MQGARGLIPARAGQIIAGCEYFAWYEIDPRSRGADFTASQLLTLLDGLIPARAGQIAAPLLSKRLARIDPRSRGADGSERPPAMPLMD